MFDTANIAMIYSLHCMSLKTMYYAEDHQGRQDSLDQRLHRCHHRGRCLCRWLQRWCTACCSSWSPPTAAGSLRFPPTSDCRSRHQFQMSRAWQQRSYLNNVCVGQGQGTERTREGRVGRQPPDWAEIASKEEDALRRETNRQKMKSSWKARETETFH